MLCHALPLATWPLAGAFTCPTPASHLLLPTSQNRKVLAFSRYRLHTPLPLSLGWGSHAFPPCSSGEDGEEGSIPSPDCLWSWIMRHDQSRVALFPRLNTK